MNNIEWLKQLQNIYRLPIHCPRNIRKILFFQLQERLYTYFTARLNHSQM